MLKNGLYLISFIFIISQSVDCQLIPERIPLSQLERNNNQFIVGKIPITTPLEKSLKDYFQIVDTIDFVQEESDLVEVEGYNFQFDVRIKRDSLVYNSGGKQHLVLESHIPPYQLWRYDITYLNSIELAAVAQELRSKPYHKPVLSTSSGQNCISYALEGIFRSHGINPEPFFFRRSYIAEHNDTDLILKNLFVKVETLDNIKRSSLKKSESLHEDQVFILFRSKQGEPMHACFNLNGRIWTKNGYMPYMSYSTLQPVIDTYSLHESYKVSRIEIYKLNYEIFE